MEAPGTHLYFTLLTVHVLYRREKREINKNLIAGNEVKQ